MSQCSYENTWNLEPHLEQPPLVVCKMTNSFFFLMNKNLEWIYIKEDTWVVNNSMERCSTSLIIKEM